jgi:hypothetical protein
MTAPLKIRTVAGTPATMDELLQAVGERVPPEQRPELVRLLSQMAETLAQVVDLAGLASAELTWVIDDERAAPAAPEGRE